MKFHPNVVLRVLLSFNLSLLGCSAEEKSEANYPTRGLTNGTTLPVISGPNVLPLTVNGGLCSANSYINKPCVSVTICEPGNSSNCQTISDILLDTGSYGLRVFKSVLNTSVLSALTPVMSGGQTIAECVRYGDGSKDWGPIKRADVVLGEEPAITVPIQVIDSTFSNSSAYCSNAETGPAAAGFNGILGVGFYTEDCGTVCTKQAANGLYFGCTGSTCASTAISLTDQVQNPVSLLPTDNNGVIIELPVIPFEGASSVDGYFVLGIGTRSNNVPGSVSVYSADEGTGEMTTQFNSKSYGSFIDSGSNGLFFSANLKDCGSLSAGFTGWYCPSTLQSLTAVNLSSSGQGGTVEFNVGNLINLANSTDNRVFLEVGGDSGGSLFDWGLPFYIGRNVYHGIDGKSSSLGTGPYWAY